MMTILDIQTLAKLLVATKDKDVADVILVCDVDAIETSYHAFKTSLPF